MPLPRAAGRRCENEQRCQGPSARPGLTAAAAPVPAGTWGWGGAGSGQDAPGAGTHGDRAQAAQMPQWVQSVGRQRGRQKSTRMGAAEKEWGWCRGAPRWVVLCNGLGAAWRGQQDFLEEAIRPTFCPKRQGLGSDFVWVSFSPRALTWLRVPMLLPTTGPRSLPGSLLESWGP